MQVQTILRELSGNPPPQRQDELMKVLADGLNDMVLHDFPALAQLLYRVDVPEHHLKTILKENPAVDAGELLAKMVVERQAAKAAARAAFRPSSQTNESDEERW